MTASPDHGHLDSSTQGIHIPFQFSFSDAASRTGAPASLLLGGASKLALQRDNFSLWLLTSVSPTPSWQQVGGSNLATGGSNIGSGIGVYDSTSGQNLQFRSLLGGPGINVSLQSNTSSVVVTASAPSATNLGAGASLYRETAASLMQFRTLFQGAGVNLAQDASTITIEASRVQYFPAQAFTTPNGASFSYEGATNYGGWNLNGGSSHSITTSFQAAKTGASPLVDIFWQVQSSAGSAAIEVTLERVGIFESAASQSIATTNLYPFPSDLSQKQKSTLSGMAISFSANDLMLLKIARPSAASGDSVEHTIKILGVSIY